MRLLVDQQSLILHIEGFWVVGLPMPRFLTLSIRTLEWEDGGRYRFDVAATLPGIGRLVAYRGCLIEVTECDLDRNSNA